MCCSDPDPACDEDGNPIEPTKPKVSNFSMIKKMMRLKQKQDAMPESEKNTVFVPKTQPIFKDEERAQYYFDMKNNKEHYQLMTNDLTDEDFKVFEEREKMRADALHHSRKMMRRLIERRKLEEIRLEQEKEAARNKSIDVEKLGDYQSTMFLHEQADIFQDDDELVLM